MAVTNIISFADFLREATEQEATDVYLAAGAVPCMNIDGVYQPMVTNDGQRLSADQTTAVAREAMSDKQWEHFQEEMEMNLAFMAPGTNRFRVNIFWQRGSIAIVARRVVMDIPTLRKLGLPPVLRDVSLGDRGIVLVTGSTGSGKSTSLASMIDYRNHIRTGHIVTIEDPVEFIHRHRRSIVTQREVGIDTTSFHEALKNTLRQAPQVISIGEMRDSDTVQFSMHAAETGHLVFATLHSTNTTLAIERILNFYPRDLKDQVLAQLALNLRAIIGQRLVAKSGGGRVAAVEILVMTPRITDLVSKGSLNEIRVALAAENQEGMQTFDKSLYKLVMTKQVTQNDALQAAESPNDLQLKLKGIGIEPGSSWTDLSDPWANIRDDFELPQTGYHQKFKDQSAVGQYTNEGVASLPGMQSAASREDVAKIEFVFDDEKSGTGERPIQTVSASATPPPQAPAAMPPTPPRPAVGGPPRPPQGPPPRPQAPPQRPITHFPGGPTPQRPPAAPGPMPPRPPQQRPAPPQAPPPPRPAAPPYGTPPPRPPMPSQGRPPQTGAPPPPPPSRRPSAPPPPPRTGAGDVPRYPGYHQPDNDLD